MQPYERSPQGSSVHGIFQARILEWVAVPSSRASSRPRDWTQVSCIAGRFFTTETPGKPSRILASCILGLLMVLTRLMQETARWSHCMYVKVAQSCLTLCDPMDYTVNEILQARILEWETVSSSRGSSQPRDRTQVSCIAGRFFTSWTTREAQEYWSA